MKISKSAAAIVLSCSGLFTAQAEDLSDLQVLVQVTYSDCHKATEIAPYMKEQFNQSAIRSDGTFAKDTAVLYANPVDDSYAIVVYPDSETLVPRPDYPLACLFGPNKPTGYAEFLESEQYRSIFKPQ